MFPTLIEIGDGTSPVGVHTYGMFIVLAFSAAFLLVHFRAARVGIHPDRLVINYLAAAVGGLLGARVLYTASVVFGTGLSFLLGGAFLAGWAVAGTIWARRQAESGGSGLVPVLASIGGTAVLALGALALQGQLAVAADFAVQVVSLGSGGFAVYGGVLGGAVAVLLLSQAMGLNGWKAADLAAPAVLLGMSVGRLGCFFAGCCHGAVAPIGDDPTGLLPEGLLHGQVWLSSVFPFVTLEFHDGVGRLLHQPLYPTQLLEFSLNGVLAGLLAWRWLHRRFDGEIAALALIVQPPARMLSEAFRADERGYAFTFSVSDTVASIFPGMTRAGESMGAEMGFTTSQTFGFGMMLLGVALLVMRRNAGREPEVEVVPDGGLADELLAE
jgi:phosphatidylglycerol:prolipoprotein diacylglycerol transferase